MKKIIGFVFDVDDTIYNQILPFRDACRDVLTVPVPDNPEKWYQTFLQCSQEMFRANEKGEISLEESRVQRAVNAMERCGILFTREQAVKFQERYLYHQLTLQISDTMRELEESRVQRAVNAMERCGILFTREQAVKFQERYLYHQLTLQISDTMREVLTACTAKGVCLGLLTNGPYDHQMSKIRAMHLPELIPEEHILVSEKAGYTKPDVRIFRMMEEALGLEQSQLYMIGDSYANDIAGAIGAGWHSVWMNHHHRNLPENAVQPEFTVRSEEELARLIFAHV